MKLVNIPIDNKHGWHRREVSLKKTPLKKSSAFQISELTLERNERFHANNNGYVLCFVASGWMEAHCAGKDYELHEGEGIVFEPKERHRINKGKGLMISISSVDYSDLKTDWEK